MDTKEQLELGVKKWLQLDNEIGRLRQMTESKKKEQKELSNTLMGVMKQNDIDQFDISGGALVYSCKNTKKPIGKKMMMSCVAAFYESDPEMGDKFSKYILDSRENKSVETIVRKKLAAPSAVS